MRILSATESSQKYWHRSDLCESDQLNESAYASYLLKKVLSRTPVQAHDTFGVGGLQLELLNDEAMEGRIAVRSDVC